MRKSLRVMVAALVAFAITSSMALAAVNVKSFPVATFGDPDAASVTLRGGNFSGLGSVPAIATLTVQEVNDAFRKHIDAKRLVIVQAGDFKKKPQEASSGTK